MPKFMSLPKVAIVVRNAERTICSRVWDALREFQENLTEESEKDVIDRLESLLREIIAYGPDELEEHNDGR
jgi:hypothetical protein